MFYLLPRPKEMTMLEGTFCFRYDTTILLQTVYKTGVQACIKGLQEECTQVLGYRLDLVKGIVRDNGIILEIDTTCDMEEYILEITPERILIRGGCVNGIFYGVQTLRQIMRQEGSRIPCLRIEDYPKVSFRGYYFDVSRGRIPTLDTLRKLVDKLSFYKINQLQLYIEHTYLFQNMSEVWRDETPISAEEILELDQYCRDRYVELVPSLSTFGHMYKILRMKSFSHMCELEGAEKEDFSFYDRMEHHTLDVTKPENVEFMKSLLEEYMSLFSSHHFNICGDETYDLGKGRGKELADEIGTKEVYIRYVNELCEFVLKHKKTPMFWGDIVAGFPEMLHRLPKETICLNWGYDPEQTEDTTKIFSEVNAKQIVCPGVNGWNRIMNHVQGGYKNIQKMCTYGEKYGAIGVLNTDWGDYGHMNDPEFSVPAIIYGAAFSWAKADISFEEINKEISLIEYYDRTESFVSLISEISEKSEFTWSSIVLFRDAILKKRSEQEIRAYMEQVDRERAVEYNKNLGLLKEKLYRILATMDTLGRKTSKNYLVAIDSMIIFNEISLYIGAKRFGLGQYEEQTGWELAEKLEKWFHYYKQVWRSREKESELYRIGELIMWYGDYLRESE